MVQVAKGWCILIYLDFMQYGYTGTMGEWYLSSSAGIYDGQFSQVLILIEMIKIIQMIMNNEIMMKLCIKMH